MPIRRLITSGCRTGRSRPAGAISAVVIGVYPAVDGTHVWVFERCGNRYCNDFRVSRRSTSSTPRASQVKSFGAGLFVFPHGLSLDRNGNIWVTDADIKDGKGNRSWKSAQRQGADDPGQEGRRFAAAPTNSTSRATWRWRRTAGSLRRRRARAGTTASSSCRPTANSSRPGASTGRDPGEFRRSTSSLAFDSQGRLFVADRGNSRLQLFDQDGKFLAEWRQFGKPRGIYIDRHDKMYVSIQVSRTPRLPASAAASASAAPRPARSRPSSPTPIRRIPAPASAPAASPKASPPTPPAMSMAARRRRRRW